jgi:tellurite resistance protein
MSTVDAEQLAMEYASALQQCRLLYRSAAQICIDRFPTWIPNSHQEFVEHLEELHKALVAKIYVYMVEGDRIWSAGERALAKVLLEHIHGAVIEKSKIAAEMRGLSDQVNSWTWYTLIRPFDQIPALRERVAELETCALRQANIVAKVDGAVSPEEVQRLHSLQQSIQMHLRPLRIEERKSQVIPPPFA